MYQNFFCIKIFDKITSNLLCFYFQLSFEKYNESLAPVFAFDKITLQLSI